MSQGHVVLLLEKHLRGKKMKMLFRLFEDSVSATNVMAFWRGKKPACMHTEAKEGK